MAYYTLALIKKNLEILPSDTSLDATLDLYGAEADAWLDSVLGRGTALATVPTTITHIASNYAAGRYLSRIKEQAIGDKIIEEAKAALREYIKGPGMINI
jgi:hypothetical protein